ncbi:hypothetical protein [Cerasicoccus maritimus]|uniref:hypothetical protein n=1 Tax=Cerasicoccus maritimus TaxID=490089 RepID=UPI0028525712|nr:hypothetical protein [Cerasicoccus maritimus]
MNAFYDKIILAVGVLALAGSGAFYATQKASANSDASKQPFGDDYSSLEVADFSSSTAEWGDPIPQDEAKREKYDVFTPPKIWWDAKEGKFIFEAPGSTPPPPPFGITFLGVEQELFRIQLEAYFEALSGDFKDATVSLFDYNSNEAFRGKVGDKFPEHNVEIIDFEVNRVVDDQGLISLVPRVTIKDGESGELIVLTTAERLYVPNSYKLTFQNYDIYGDDMILWEEVGQSKTVGDVTFKLLDFDFDNQTATVEKTFADDSPTKTETLNVANAVSSEPSASLETESSEESGPAEENSGLFDSIFQN